MIKPLNCPQLSSAKQRTGLQSIAELLPRLIRNYELQAEMKRRTEKENTIIMAVESVSPVEQSTFAWYE